jgi:hypothetical protein
MTNFEQLQSMTVEELTMWLDEHGQFDGSPWTEWFGRNYCDKCESIKCKYVDAKEKLGISSLSYSSEVECAYCELNDHCKFFPQIEGIPDNKEVIKMWLNKEADYNGRSTDSKSAN